jgi:hypothetical protein
MTSTAILCTFRGAGTPTYRPRQSQTCDTIAATDTDFKPAVFRLRMPTMLLAAANKVIE